MLPKIMRSTPSDAWERIVQVHGPCRICRPAGQQLGRRAGPNGRVLGRVRRTGPDARALGREGNWAAGGRAGSGAEAGPNLRAKRVARSGLNPRRSGTGRIASAGLGRAGWAESAGLDLHKPKDGPSP
ncbi:hypothetical protein CRG98_046272 [Punica granatum]|uniref:Uncharacterized protein n=1 Tax=Punica granatum TaxID=22663 RepID=A0A2I0HNM8_PUNGR|nr:hypothetical protein CRG98_046272 [Punica granatum]